MTLKFIGAILVISGCGSIGFLMALRVKREIVALRRLLSALDYMACELEFRLTPLPELCKSVSNHSAGAVAAFFRLLGEEMERQVSPDAASCLTVALGKTPQIPAAAADILKELGRSLGAFDLQGQLKGLQAAQNACREKFAEFETTRVQRTRSYQTLGLCAGAALAILLI